MFKAGDRIVANQNISGKIYLTLGKIYTIERCEGGLTKLLIIKDDSDELNPYYEFRFDSIETSTYIINDLVQGAEEYEEIMKGQEIMEELLDV